MTDLFSWSPKYPDRPGFKEPTTSRDAAERVAPTAKRDRGMVLTIYRAAWPAALTPDEVAARCGRSVLSIRPRCTELTKTGDLMPVLDGKGKFVTRANESGARAKVLVCKRPGAE